MSEQVRVSDDVRAQVADLRRIAGVIRAEVARGVIGQEKVVEAVLLALLCDGHVLLEGVPGVGKTLLVRTLARVLALQFGRVQFTPDLMPADVTGTTVVHETEDGGKRTREFRFQRGPVFAQLLLADEINRATPKTQSALLEAMQERTVTMSGTTHKLPAPFLVMATQNPIEQEGTFPLPEAQLDRFLFKIIVPTPGRKDLTSIVERTTSAPGIEPAAATSGEQLLAFQALVRRAPVAPHVTDYAVRLVLATHPSSSPGGGEFATPTVNRFVRLGASPRAAQALMLAGKARALLDGRFSPSIEDVRASAGAALRHRIILNFEAYAEAVTTDAVVENVVATLPVDAPA